MQSKVQMPSDFFDFMQIAKRQNNNFFIL